MEILDSTAAGHPRIDLNGQLIVRLRECCLGGLLYMKGHPLIPNSLLLGGEFPYLTRKIFGGTEFNFWICDKVGRLWYDSPPAERISEPGEFIVDRQTDSGWLEMDLLRTRIAIPGSRLLDIGCHHGLTTVLLAGWVGDEGLVYAFDAVLKNAFITSENLLVNSIKNASVFGSGVGADIFLADAYNDSNVILKRSGDERLKSTLVVPLAGLFPHPIDAVKVDIEGFELDLVRTHKEFFRTIPRLSIEVHTDMLPPNSVHEIADLLNSRRLYVLSDESDLHEYESNRTYDKRLHLLSW